MVAFRDWTGAGSDPLGVREPAPVALILPPSFRAAGQVHSRPWPTPRPAEATTTVLRAEVTALLAAQVATAVAVAEEQAGAAVAQAHLLVADLASAQQELGAAGTQATPPGTRRTR